MIPEAKESPPPTRSRVQREERLGPLRLHRSVDLGIKTIARRLGMARNMVRAALAAHEPPKHERRTVGSSVDAFEPAIRDLLGGFPDMPATVIAERVAWTGSSSVRRARVG